MVCIPGKHESRHEVHKVNNPNSISPMSVKQQQNPTLTDNEFPQVVVADKASSTSKRYYGVDESKPDDSGLGMTIRKRDDSTEAFAKFDPIPSFQYTSNLSTRRVPLGKKVYCSHWMSTGECDYAQQGCLYKHEMPTDLELLNQLGFQDIPKWYREKHGYGKLTAVPGSGAHIRGPSRHPAILQPNWRSLMTKSQQSSFPQMIRQPRKSIAPKPVRPTTNQNLLDLDSPAGMSSSPFSQTASLMQSKYADKPLRASESNTDDRSTTTGSGSEADVSTSSKTQTPDLSTESASIKSHAKSNSNKANKNGSEHAKHKFSTSQNTTAVLTYRSRSTNHQISSRRESLASDYEDELVRKNTERDEREAREYAKIKARAASEQE